MARFPCLPFWTDAWLADTHHLRGLIGRQKRDLYLHILILMWKTPGCRVPNDDAWLMERLYVTEEELVELLRPVIDEFCQTDGNWITQKRLMREYVRQHEIKHWQSVRAKSRENNKRKRTHEAPAGGATSTSTSTPQYKPSSPGESQQPTPVENPSASEWVTALHDSAPARSPPPQPTQKNPADLTLAEINARWHPAGTRPPD